MNITLPPDRDLPAGRHTEIRAAVVRATGRPARTRRLVPVLAAAAALVAIGLVVWLVPAGGDGTDSRPAATTTAPIDLEQRYDEVARDCVRAAGLTGDFEQRQFIDDEGGHFAVVYGDVYVLACDANIDDTTVGLLTPFTPPVSLDIAGASPGGDTVGARPENVGRFGWEYAAGRVAPEVAKVTVTQGLDSVDASIADGTYVGRIIRSPDWAVPDDNPAPVVRAYDANGKLLAEVGGE